MTFPVDRLRDYLWQQFRIPSELIRLDTQLRHELQLTDGDVEAMIRFLSDSMGVNLPSGAPRQLTDVLDLMVYVLLRMTEQTDFTEYASDPIWPLAGLPLNNYRELGESMPQRLNLN